MNVVYDDKIKFSIFLFGISYFFIFFSVESAFCIQSILLPIFFLICYFIISRKKVKFNNIFIYCLSLFFLYFVSTLINMLKFQLGFKSIIQLFYQLIIFIWFILLTNDNCNKREVDFCEKCMVITCFLSSCFVLFQNLILSDTIFSLKNFFGYRIDKNFYSAFMCMGGIVLFDLILYSKFDIKKLFAFLVILIGILFSNSRSSMIAFFISCIISIFVFFGKKITFNRIFLLIFMALVTFIMYKPILNLLPSWMYNRYFVTSYVDNSNKERISMWSNAFEGFFNSPIIGYGPGNMTLIPEYSQTSFGSIMSTTTMSHNTYIDMLVNGGIIGFIIFLSLLFFIFKKAFLFDKRLIPLVFSLVFTSFIVGAGKSVFFWNTLIFILLRSNYNEFDS